jgi:predicted  nucleic acid-binding Zn-ribbon protein
MYTADGRIVYVNNDRVINQRSIDDVAMRSVHNNTPSSIITPNKHISYDTLHRAKSSIQRNIRNSPIVEGFYAVRGGMMFTHTVKVDKKDEEDVKKFVNYYRPYWAYYTNMKLMATVEKDKLNENLGKALEKLDGLQMRIDAIKSSMDTIYDTMRSFDDAKKQVNDTITQAQNSMNEVQDAKAQTTMINSLKPHIDVWERNIQTQYAKLADWQNYTERQEDALKDHRIFVQQSNDYINKIKDSLKRAEDAIQYVKDDMESKKENAQTMLKATQEEAQNIQSIASASVDGIKSNVKGLYKILDTVKNLTKGLRPVDDDENIAFVMKAMKTVNALGELEKKVFITPPTEEQVDTILKWVNSKPITFKFQYPEEHDKYIHIGNYGTVKKQLEGPSKLLNSMDNMIPKIKEEVRTVENQLDSYMKAF